MKPIFIFLVHALSSLLRLFLSLKPSPTSPKSRKSSSTSSKSPGSLLISPKYLRFVANLHYSFKSLRITFFQTLNCRKWRPKNARRFRRIRGRRRKVRRRWRKVSPAKKSPAKKPTTSRRVKKPKLVTELPASN